MTVDDCRKLLSEGRLGESLDALEMLRANGLESAPLYHYLAVTLHLLGRSGEALQHFERSLELDPGQASVYQNQAIALLATGDVERAIESAKRAIAIRGDNVGAYVNLALAQSRLKLYADAWETISRGLELAPDHPGLLSQAGHIAIEARNYPLAESYIARALTQAPDNAEINYNAGVLYQAQSRDADALAAYDKALRQQAWHEGAFANKGVVLRNLGRIGESIRHFRKGLTHWPEWAVLKYNLAITDMLAGNWSQAWADFELRADVAGSRDKSPKVESPVWNGEEIKDKVLLVVHEQGFGDTFQFIRFLPQAIERAGQVTFVCQNRLYSILSRLDMFKAGGITLVSDDAPLPAHDVHVPLMSLARLFGAIPDGVPRPAVKIALEEQRVRQWAALGASTGKKWRIGLSWQGNPNASIDKDRSVPLSAFAPLAGLSDKADFISLQQHFGHDQPSPEGLDIVVPPLEFDSGRDAFVDSAALMMSLDLVITSDTAIAHLAGLLGRPVWLLLKAVPDWRWGVEGVLTPWYPTMRLIRQRAFGDWSGLIDEAAKDLDRLIGDVSVQPSIASENGARAVEFHTQGKFREARELYESAAGGRKGDAPFLNFYAMAVLEEGRRSRNHARLALPLAAHSVALSPRNGDLWSNYAVLLDGLGSPNDSKRAVRFALDVQPDHTPSLISLAKKESAGGNTEAALEMLDKVVAAEPNSASAHSARAAVLTDMEQLGDAETAMRRALDLDPNNARLWVQLGAIQSAAKRHRNSADSWERALACDPGNADAFSNLGVYERNHGELEIACWFSRRAVECDPNHAEAWNNLGISELEAGRDDFALAAFRRAIAVRPDYADAHLALGMALLNGGDFTNGFKHYEGRLRSDKLGIAVGRPNVPYWRGGDPKGLSILLMAEQGFGDAFQFSRYARLLKDRGAAKVLIGCRSKIAHLLGTIPGVDGVIGDGDKVPPVDAMAYMMSLPFLTGMQLDTIPAYETYLTADPARVTHWAEWLAKKPGYRVGVVWQGNPDPKVDKGRSYPLERLEPLAEIPGVRLIALQKGAGEEQIAALDGRFEIEQPGADFDSGPNAFADTAAMMMNLDLIVTSDTAVAHLAGALGKPCWVILKSHPEWRWLTGRSDSPWYPQTRVFRRVRNEVEDAPFAGVVGRLADALAKLVSGDLAQRHVKEMPDGIEVKPFDPAASFNSALAAQRKDDYETATHLYGEVLGIRKLLPGALNMLGAMALQKDRNHRAVVFFDGAERAGLKSADLMTNYAIGLRRVGDIGKAIEKLESVISTTPTAESHLSLANIHRDECNFEQSLANYRAALALRPDFAKAHRGIGNLMRDMHRPAESLAAFEKARALDPGDPDLVLDHAHAKLFDGDFIGGFRDYEARWQSKEMRPRTFREPRWNGEHAPGKVLMIHGEQGFGDNIQFARFVSEATRRVGRVVLEVRGPLVELMKHLQTERPITIVEQGAPIGKFDFQIPMLSLPVAFGTTVDTVPPPARFDLDPERIQHWKSQLPSGGLKIGLIWQGNPKARADAGRSPPLAALAPLFSLPGSHFISLQKSDGLDQLRNADFADKLISPGAALGDFYETAHAIAALDYVVSSCTATLHLAATLGVPVFGMLKYHADWRWLNETDRSPWYPSLKLFRQQNVHEWDAVVNAIRANLAEQMVGA
ncbi:tetratricopeptide repeat protein [Rhizobium sp. LjRoot254]|uniref:tetratricopeptide repeat protein n=1 Tax=Rhizobium sp. LjRoot254 TaxID=3342297 RepID=UPI003ECF6AD0